MKIQKHIFWAGGGRGEGSVGGGQGACERRIEVFVKIQKKIFFLFFFFWGGGGGRVWDVNEELKFLRKFKIFFFFFFGGGSCWNRGQD